MMDLDPRTRRILDLAREARTPSASDKARVEGLLAASIALGANAANAASAATGAAAGKAAGTTLALKWFAGVTLCAAAGSVVYTVARSSTAPRDARPPAVAPSPVARAIAATPAREATAGAPAVTVTPDRPAEAAKETETPAPVTRNAPVRSPITNHPASTLSEELDLLHEAQLEWRRGDAAGALASLARHRQRYPRSVLGPERDALTVLASCATGRTEDARRIARRFLQSAPRSPLRTSVEESCGGR